MLKLRSGFPVDHPMQVMHPLGWNGTSNADHNALENSSDLEKFRKARRPRQKACPRYISTGGRPTQTLPPNQAKTLVFIHLHSATRHKVQPTSTLRSNTHPASHGTPTNILHFTTPRELINSSHKQNVLIAFEQD